MKPPANPADLLARLLDRGSLHPDFWRAVRATIAFMVPLAVAVTAAVPLDLAAVSIAGQNIAMLEVRGDYRLRLVLLVLMAGVFALAAAIGATVASAPATAILATGLIAVLGGVWRHLSSDYGPPLAIASSLVFFLALAAPEARSHVGAHAVAALAGGLWGVLVQVAAWPFRPQHPLRRAVAESWLAVGSLFQGLVPPAAAPAPAADELPQQEGALRTALDQAYAVLETSPAGAVRDRLEAVNLACARLATRVVALHTALESARALPHFAALKPALDATFASLADLSRGAAVTLVSRQPSHLATLDVRLREVASFLGVLRARLAVEAAHGQLAELTLHIERMLPEIHRAILATVERAGERTAVGLELRELGNLALRPLASALNLNLQVDPALVRYTLRLAAFTMLATAVYQHLGLPHGYWLPFTIIVVLQPDFGSTRQRALERVAGTLAGSIVASGLLYLDLPVGVLLAAVASGVFAFAYWLKRNYAIAIFCVTVFLVLVTEAHAPVTIAFTAERLAITLAGGALALLAAFLFWPVWERDRLPSILAHTFRANQAYLRLLLDRLARGQAFDRDGILAKRRAEAANTAAFSSLRRLSGDPRNQREGLEHAAALVNGNQRLTRLCNALTLHLSAGTPVAAAPLDRFGTLAARALDQLALAAERGPPPPAQLEPLIRELESELFPGPATADRDRWVQEQLRRAATELSALLLTLQLSAP